MFCKPLNTQDKRLGRHTDDHKSNDCNQSIQQHSLSGKDILGIFFTILFFTIVLILSI